MATEQAPGDVGSGDDETEDHSAKFVNTAITNEELRRDDQDWRPLRREMHANLQQRLRFESVFREWPMLDACRSSASEFARRFLAQPEAYSWCLDFDKDLFCELAYEGFLCTSLQIAAGGGFMIQILLPWNDPKRNVLDWRDLHVSHQVRKRAKRYTMTVDAAYDDVMLGCIRMHGEGWLYRGLRWLLRQLFAQGYQGKQDIQVGVHSFELWDQEGQLVAGDLGYTVGGVYTSMTGFRVEGSQGAGEVQMVLTGGLLAKMGCLWWDLGMVMKYKARLGAKVVTRQAFVDRLRADRDRRVACKHDRVGGQELLRHLLDLQASTPSTAPGSQSASSGGAGAVGPVKHVADHPDFSPATHRPPGDERLGPTSEPL